MAFGSGQPVIHGFDAYRDSNLSRSELADLAISRPWPLFALEIYNFSQGVTLAWPSAADRTTRVSQNKSETDKPSTGNGGESSSNDGKKSLAVRAAPALWIAPIALLWWL